jgi:hypothetical protein
MVLIHAQCLKIPSCTNKVWGVLIAPALSASAETHPPRINPIVFTVPTIIIVLRLEKTLQLNPVRRFNSSPLRRSNWTPSKNSI